MADHGFDDQVRFVASAGGTAGFHVQAAADTDHSMPQDAGAVNTHRYEYYAMVGDQFERGFGTWVQATLTLQRTEINSTSNDDDAPVNFLLPPTVDMFPAHATTLEPGFAPTTAMVFYQATAPVGWTKQTAHDDKALRVVSGATGGASGGSYAFSTVFGRYQTDSHAIDGNELTYHTHYYNDYYQTTDPNSAVATGSGAYQTQNYNVAMTETGHYLGAYTAAAGASYGHVHGVEMRVQYMDVLVCTKD